MVSILSIICMIITLFLSLVLPIAFFVWYGKAHKQKGIWMAGILGACGFTLLQIGIRLPVLSVIGAIPGFLLWVEQNYILYCLLLAFTAGLFEVVARYGVAKILEKGKGITDSLSYEIGFMAGIGHGGVEAVALVGATYINNLLFTILVNTGAWNKILSLMQSSGQPAETYEVYASIPVTLIETPWYLYLAGGYERLLTMIAHIAMTMVVFYFVRCKKDVIGILISLGWHTAIDFFVPLLNGFATDYLGNRISQNTAYVLMYALLTVIAFMAIIVIIRLKKYWPLQEEITAPNADIPKEV